MAQTHFGYQTVDETEKASRVRGVFDSVASRYDVMNDVLSMGLHRVWKAYTVAVANVQPGMQVLDIAGGTGDLARAFAQRAGASGRVVLTDINEAMLRTGRDRLMDEGLVLPTAACDAEHLPFVSGSTNQGFDLVSVAFGLRNMTHKEAALTEMCRVLKPGGRLLVLEFSKPAAALQKPYDWYSFTFMPAMGKLIAGDGDSYRYLAESIRMHPDQATLKALMQASGFAHVDVHKLAGGIVALHVGVKC
ncbi:MAG: bifunctional demethylmenaquinone methyltransferase/2-methoxy-6-polyprenyl-1,4-benzoquinol methylase UbiE [Rubrivivax sp.]|nr:bifunctional demethylmenaquinone methyltransferase/2-methoxy-6-polyprenyl-1,4-benzoquinol methylase UbiE [Rubrivivax sp.]